MWRTRVTKSGRAQQYGEPHSPKSGEARAPRAIRSLRLCGPWLFGDGVWAQLAACIFKAETSPDPNMDYGLLREI